MRFWRNLIWVWLWCPLESQGDGVKYAHLLEIAELLKAAWKKELENWTESPLSIVATGCEHGKFHKVDGSHECECKCCELSFEDN